MEVSNLTLGGESRGVFQAKLLLSWVKGVHKKKKQKKNTKSKNKKERKQKKKKEKRKRKNQSINIEEEQRKIEKKNRFFGPDDV